MNNNENNSDNNNQDASNVSSTVNGANQRRQEAIDGSELPFLVTHWLHNLKPTNIVPHRRNDGNGCGSQQKALQQIHRAAADLASAFSSLGAFGVSTVPSLTSGVEHESATVRNATFADLNRRWKVLPSNHLDNIISAAVGSTLAADEVVNYCAKSNLIHAADEAIQRQRRNPASGRTVQDAIEVDNKEESTGAETVIAKPSILQSQVKMNFDFKSNNFQGSSERVQQRSVVEARKMPVFQSTVQHYQKECSQSMRRYLDQKETVESQASEIRSLQSSLKNQEKIKLELQDKRLAKGASLNPEAFNISEEEQNANRVIAQIQRKLEGLQTSHARATEELAKSKQSAYKSYEGVRSALQSYQDPIVDFEKFRPVFGRNAARNNGIFRLLESRRIGLPAHQARTQNLVGIASSSHHAGSIQKALALSRYSHAVTINSHLHYPVFCLRFDRTGRFFVTGSDDRLVKVFCLGAKQTLDSTGKGRLGPDQVQASRGAVLVCTLRGHADVINDIDVSSDNCFLATASEDGDCRVWGLKDGAPIAILRGHIGGCTMVSWSTITPFRLVTTGEDGFARTWDIREAALKRYKALVGSRPEYLLRLTEDEKKFNASNPRDEQRPDSAQQSVNLPPLPERQIHQEDAPVGPDEPPLPPLPMPAADGSAGDGVANAAANANDAENNARIVPGQFVANDMMDEGVKLVAKFQHGSSLEERMAAPGTRARRAAVKVMCVARCPLGGYFATGADDGICRVWEDCDDVDVETVDNRICMKSVGWLGSSSWKKPRLRRSLSSQNHPLLQLKGHLNAITDLQYSHAGDRIMTGSQKDGVVRIWSWESVNLENSLRHILLKLTNPVNSATLDSRKSRRRNQSGPTASNESKIELDVAVWTHDDSKIITSQSQPIIRQGKLDTVPGSHFLFVWDSLSGHCLLGIAGAHSMNCQVILPHPTNASIFCSGSTDGYMKVWDCETGNCLFTHKNTIEHGDVDSVENGAKCGPYLDGAFMSDGTAFILTDGCGSVSIFDSSMPKSHPSSQESSALQPDAFSPPLWLREQYFSSDYYDLNYETNGYVVERGSSLPPHLAPRGARCSHSAAPFSENVTEAFRKLVGPIPLPVKDCQWRRDSIRFRSRMMFESNKISRGIAGKRRGNITLQEFDPLTTILIRSSGEVLNANTSLGDPEASQLLTTDTLGATVNQGAANEVRRSSYSGRQLSSNYRWRDYTDMLQEERNYDDDSDDDDFEPVSRSNGNNRRSASASAYVDESDDSDDELLENFLDDAPSPRARRSVSRTDPAIEENRPPRASNRRRASRNRYEDSDESDFDEDLQMLSTNNDPSGPYAEDYNTHLFRLPSHTSSVKRKWLRRMESNSGYEGRRVYCPQVGDEVVYIPRAHFETIQAFPSVRAPWQDFPAGSEWPVVCCRIRNIRYRFPFQDYYGRRSTGGNKCNSIVAILSLEVTGIPVHSTAFAWPSASFIAPAKSHYFELDVFESGAEEFVIPYDRYCWRIKCLEEAIQNQDGNCENIKIACYYDDDNQDEEDADLILYPGQMSSYQLRESPQHDENLNNCGYRAVGIVWPENDDSSDLSPWEVITQDPKSTQYEFSRPCLNDEDKKRARKALDSIIRMGNVKELFTKPVDKRKYVDYEARIPVPLCLDDIKRRLSANYYSTRWSIVADVKLIKDNCLKYNGEGDLQEDARKMYHEFEQAMLDDNERKLYNDLSIATVTATDQSLIRSSGTRSSLENLPPPPGSSSSGDTERRRSLRIRLDISRANETQAARSSAGSLVEPIDSVSQSMARARQSRGRANGSGGNARRQRGAFAGQQAANSPSRNGRPRRHSSTRAQGPSHLEQLDRSSRAGRASARSNTRHTGNINHEELDAIGRRTRSHDVILEGHDSESVVGRRTRSHDAIPDDNDWGSDTKPPARPSRRGTSLLENLESASDTEHKSDRHPLRRSSRARTAAFKQESSEESQDESEQSASRSRKRKARSKATSDIENSEEEPVSEEDSFDDVRDSADEKVDDAEYSEGEQLDSEASDDAESEDDQSEFSGPPRKKSAGGAKRRRSVPPERMAQSTGMTRASRRASMVTKSYADHSESEFEETQSDEESDEVPTGTSRKRSSVRSPERHNRRAPKKTKKGRYTGNESDDYSDSNTGSDSEAYTPQKSKARSKKVWREIPKAAISKVTHRVLKHLKAKDTYNLFQSPVLEDYPDLAEEYLKVVQQPMDFRTIEEERIHYYHSITELQQDLELTLRNCVAYNGKLSVYALQAESMLGILPDVFQEAVDHFNL